MFKLRPKTLDEYIYRQVVEFNEYNLPDSFLEDDIVIDVGAHIGTFAYAALKRGARRIYCIEADVDNLEIARSNLKVFIDRGWVSLVYGAAWRSDDNDDVLYFDGYPQMGAMSNTGGGRVLTHGNGRLVPKTNFDAFVSNVTRHGRERVRFLKLDCEGSEWPILFTSKTLPWLDEIRGEIHETFRPGSCRNDGIKGEGGRSFEKLVVEDLLNLLTEQNFEVEYLPSFFQVAYFERLGILSAIRRCNDAQRRKPGAIGVISRFMEWPAPPPGGIKLTGQSEEGE
jgi:FkbM family methyltransferase